MRPILTRLMVVAVLVLPASCAGRGTRDGGDSVILRDETLEILTYRLGPPEPNPVFFDGRSYQGAKGPIYPYPLLDRLSTRKAPQSWRAVRLENKYVQLIVLPEIGGRLFSGLDKTNGYDFFYRQHVIKPALIGMAGAWISGGVEWNVFHHHRVTSFMPVECTLQEHPDGSKTVWIGETELRHRMRWIIGLTLHPDRSYVEATLRFFNRTPLPHAFLYFANPAVAVNENYQAIFPPRTEWATSHTKDQFVEWPVAQREYKGVDYKGVDLSWIRNHPKPNSFFAWNHEDAFIAGYDHGKKAGVMHVADPRIVPGKKLWQWGTGPTGKMWEKILTDADGPYAEIMVGAWSDNQPDYSWMQPGEVKDFKQYWYPIREIGGVKNATVDAAVELEPVRDGAVKLGFNTTAEHREARAVLSGGDRVVFEQTVCISPDRPFVTEVRLPAGVKAEEVRAALSAKDGRELVAYAPVRRKGEPMPETYRLPAPPREIKTVDELTLAGSRLEQFYNPHHEPDTYYEEALRRDPGDVRANTALGILHLKRGMFAEARARFREALKRAAGNHTKAREGAPHYYLGVALRALGRDAEAAESFARASWDHAFASASWRALAELACRREDWADALGGLDRALSTNALDTRALALKAAVLRRSGRPAEAHEAAGRALAIDPLDPFAGSERILSAGAGDGNGTVALHALLGNSPQPYLELACDYDSAGMAFEALHVLGGAPAPDAMVHYHRGWLLERTGHAAEAAACFEKGAAAPWEGCFPSRFESAEALRAALKDDPRDARARLYLGNLYYDVQPEKAIGEWEAAVRLDPSLSPAHRNLGFAYLRRGDADEAVAAYEQALAGNREDPLLLVELDQAGEAAGRPPAKRLKPLEENRETALRKDRAVGRLAWLMVMLGRFDEAIDLLSKHPFHLWEGEAGMYGLYVEARARRGEKSLAAGRAAEALKDFEAALEVPPNIEVWAEFGEGRPRLSFLMGMALRGLGKAEEAKARLEKAAGARGGGAMAYYAGRALAELGRKGEAEKVFADLAESSRRRAAAIREGENFHEKTEGRRRRAEAHYAAGLGLLGLGRDAEARAEFEKAVRLDASHAGARRVLARD
jgi:tetratricopeptide (TPR) repeat protein